MGEVEAAGESLGTDEDVDGAGFDVVVETGKVVGFFVVAVETGNAGFGEEVLEFGFEELGTEAFMNDAGVMAVGAARRNFFAVAAEVTTEGIGIGMEGHR